MSGVYDGRAACRGAGAISSMHALGVVEVYGRAGRFQAGILGRAGEHESEPPPLVRPLAVVAAP